MTLTMLLRWQSAVAKTDAMSLHSVDLSEAAPTGGRGRSASRRYAGLLSLFGRVFVIGSREWFE